MPQAHGKNGQQGCHRRAIIPKAFHSKVARSCARSRVVTGDVMKFSRRSSLLSAGTLGALLRRVVGALALLSSFQAACTADQFAIEHGGVTRHYLMHRPPGAESSARPAVIYLHGLRPADWKNHTQAEIDALADREGFVAVYPEAIEYRWNYAGVPDGATQVQGNAVDDVGFISKLLDDLIERKIADPTRIYVLGDSRGGLMTYELMCRMADRIAAAGPLITGMTDAQRDACRPALAVPVLVVAGVNDPIQPYDGWLTAARRLLSIPETMEFWRVRHGCTGQTRKLLPHRNPADTTRIALLEWTGCSTPNAVKLYKVGGGGHQVPSFAPASPDWVRQAGAQNQDIETIDEFWSFAKQFRR
jgi:polyhydroxybutyrate depolymerase